MRQGDEVLTFLSGKLKHRYYFIDGHFNNEDALGVFDRWINARLGHGPTFIAITMLSTVDVSL